LTIKIEINTLDSHGATPLQRAAEHNQASVMSKIVAVPGTYLLFISISSCLSFHKQHQAHKKLKIVLFIFKLLKRSETGHVEKTGWMDSVVYVKSSGQLRQRFAVAYLSRRSECPKCSM
jgi:hypothetical protein